jgi:arylsulfatase A-like enzyme
MKFNLNVLTVIQQKRILTMLAVTSAALIGAGSVMAAPRPNIVHIFTDDLGQQDVECYRGGRESLYETPNMNKLAANGMRFTHAYSPSPTCAPSRSAFMTGQYAPRNGILHVMGGLLPRPLAPHYNHVAPFYSCRIPVDANTIARTLSQAGYITGHIKKMHVGGRSGGYPYPLTYGFDFSWGKHHDYNDPELWDKKMKHKLEYTNGLWLPMKPNRLHGFATSDPDDPFRTDPKDDDRPFDGTVDLSLRWMEKVRHGDQPFFLNYCTSLVHGPVSARDRKRFEHYCKKLGIPVPTKLGSMNKTNSGQLNPYYATMVDTTDWIVGKLVKYLEATDDPRNPGHKLIENTYVILSTDNGGCTSIPAKTESGGVEYEHITDNAPLREGKQTLYEGGVRIPFIVRGPKVKNNSVSGAIVSLIDLFPTFMAIAGAEEDPQLELDGCNILPVLHGADATPKFTNGTPRKSLYFHYPVETPMASAIRKENWKLYLNIGPGVNPHPVIELFKLTNEDGSDCDVGEKNNLADAEPAKTAELLGELEAWLAEQNAAMPYKNPQFDGALEGKDQVASVASRGSDGGTVYVTVDTKGGKTPIESAILIYTTNGSDFLRMNTGSEEWFQAPALVKGNRIEAEAPPGMTHGVFYLRDANNFLITSESLPPVSEINYSHKDSTYLKDAYFYKPGLISMIKCGESALTHAKQQALDVTALTTALQHATQTAATPVSEEPYAKAIREVRKEIRALKGIPEAELEALNYFPVTDW